MLTTSQLEFLRLGVRFDTVWRYQGNTTIGLALATASAQMRKQSRLSSALILVNADTSEIQLADYPVLSFPAIARDEYAALCKHAGRVEFPLLKNIMGAMDTLRSRVVSGRERLVDHCNKEGTKNAAPLASVYLDRLCAFTALMSVSPKVSPSEIDKEIIADVELTKKAFNIESRGWCWPISPLFDGTLWVYEQSYKNAVLPKDISKQQSACDWFVTTGELKELVAPLKEVNMTCI